MLVYESAARDLKLLNRSVTGSWAELTRMRLTGKEAEGRPGTKVQQGYQQKRLLTALIAASRLLRSAAHPRTLHKARSETLKGG